MIFWNSIFRGEYYCHVSISTENIIRVLVTIGNVNVSDICSGVSRVFESAFLCMSLK